MRVDPLVTLIRDYLRRNPHLRLRLGIERKPRIRLLPRGGYNLNYRVTSKKADLVFRFNLDAYRPVRNQINYEFAILRHLERFSLAPRPYFADSSRRHFPYGFLVEEYVPNDPGPRTIRGKLEKIALVLRRLHHIPPPTLPGAIRHTGRLLGQWNDILIIARKLECIRPHNQVLRIFLEQKKRIAEYVTRHAKIFRFARLCLNHGDVVLENVLFTRGKTRLIDWQGALIDDASYDLASVLCDLMTYWNLRRALTEREKDWFLRNYGANNAERQRVLFRLPLVYVELLLHMAFRTAALRVKAQQPGLPSSERVFLKEKRAQYLGILRRVNVPKLFRLQ